MNGNRELIGLANIGRIGKFLIHRSQRAFSERKFTVLQCDIGKDVIRAKILYMLFLQRRSGALIYRNDIVHSQAIYPAI